MVTLRADFAPGAFFVLRSDFFSFGLVVFRGVFGFVFFAMAIVLPQVVARKREAYRRAPKKVRAAWNRFAGRASNWPFQTGDDFWLTCSFASRSE
jgi:hypothetical protein